jgi:putative DNA primase/helicase
MTGGEQLTGERKFEHPFKFWPQFKLFLGTNHLPAIRGTDHGIWRRLICVPFDTVYWRADRGESGPPELQADLGLEETLRGEFPGILNWLLEGCRQWQQHDLSWPPEVQAKTQGYRREQDALGQFLAACCVTGPNLRASTRELSWAYTQWCRDNDATPLSDMLLGKQLRERGFAKHDTKKERGWTGLALQEEFKASQGDDATPDAAAE